MQNENKISAISFDVDDTLWNFSDSSNTALLETINVLNKNYSETSIKLNVKELQDLRDETEIRLEGIIDDLDEIRKESFRIILAKNGISNESLLAKLYETYTSIKKTLTKPYKDVIPSIKFLKPHFKIGIISNGNCYPKDLGIENLIDFSIYSQKLSGIKKPNPTIFQIASEKINCSPKQILHIGDSYENDYIGARNSGLQSILIDRKNSFPKSKYSTTNLINSLFEITKTPYFIERKLQ